MKIVISSLMALLFSAACNAAPSADSSEHFHQAATSVYELTPLFGYSNSTVNYKTNAFGIKKEGVTSSHEEVLAEYGLNEMLSVGLTIGYSSTDSKWSPTTTFEKNSNSKGLRDPIFILKGNTPTGPGSLRFGAEFSFATEKSKTDSSGDSNQASGGWKLSPYIGFEMKNGKDFYGARMSYDLVQSDRKLINRSTGTDVSSTESGGNTLTVAGFYEMPMGSYTLGADLSIRATKETDTDKNGTTVVTSPITDMVLSVYVPIYISSNVTLLPRLSYLKVTAIDTAVVDSADGFAPEIAARIAF